MHISRLPLTNAVTHLAPRFGTAKPSQEPTPRDHQLVRQHLEQHMKRLGFPYDSLYLMDRNAIPKQDPGGGGWFEPYSPVFLEWNDQNTVHGMTPAFVQGVVDQIPGLKPASEALAELQAAGYKGYPEPGSFTENCFAYTPPVGTNLSPQKTYLVVGNIDRGEYHDQLSYFEAATRHLERRLRSLGIPEASPSLRLASYPGFSTTAAFSEAATGISGEPTYTILLNYENPPAYRKPTQGQVKAAIAQMAELKPAAKNITSLRKAGYDGYYERGKYPADVYALDLTKLAGFKADKNYPKFVLFQPYNSSTATVIKPGEQEICTALNTLLNKAGLKNGGADIRSDNGPAGPNYLGITHSGYYAPRDEVMAAIAKVPELIPQTQNMNAVSALLGAPAYLFEGSNLPELAHLSQKTMPVRIFENITDGY